MVSLETALRVAGLKPEENAYKRVGDEERAHINGKQAQAGTISYVREAFFGHEGTAQFCGTGMWTDADNESLPMLVEELKALQKEAEGLTALLLREGLFIQRKLVTPAEAVDGSIGYEYRFATVVHAQEELNKFVMALAQYAREVEREHGTQS